MEHLRRADAVVDVILEALVAREKRRRRFARGDESEWTKSSDGWLRAQCIVVIDSFAIMVGDNAQAGTARWRRRYRGGSFGKTRGRPANRNIRLVPWRNRRTVPKRSRAIVAW